MLSAKVLLNFLFLVTVKKDNSGSERVKTTVHRRVSRPRDVQLLFLHRKTSGCVYAGRLWEVRILCR